MYEGHLLSDTVAEEYPGPEPALVFDYIQRAWGVPDITGDGIDEIIVTADEHIYDCMYTVLDGITRGPVEVTEVGVPLPGFGVSEGEFTGGDFDGDGYAELVFSHYAYGVVVWSGADIAAQLALLAQGAPVETGTP